MKFSKFVPLEKMEESADGTLLVDASGEWIRLWGKT